MDADRDVLNAQVKHLPTVPVGKLYAQPVDKRLRALLHKPVKKIGEKVAKNMGPFFW